MAITLERSGQRVYLVGDTYAVKDRIKQMGGHWDGDRRAWWVGVKKEAEARALLDELAPATERDPVARAALSDRAEEAGKVEAAEALRQPPPAENLDDKRVYAQVTYKGRRYYVIAQQMSQATATEPALPVRCRLATLDGMTPFWADCADCTLVRTYEGRERWDGRRYSGKTVTKYDTIGSLRRFRDRQRDPATRREQCPECDAWHDAGEPCRECGGC